MAADVVLQTWKQISEYVGRTERTVQRWEQQFGFPVHRPSGKSRSSVMALAQEINEWTRDKPSLVVIRRSARLSRVALLPNASNDYSFDNHRTTRSSFGAPSAFPIAGSVGGTTLQQITQERIKLAGLLWEKQRNLWKDVSNLLCEQRSLRATLRNQTVDAAVTSLSSSAPSAPHRHSVAG